MPRFRLSIEYVGTRYSGWQIQKNARTIQGALAEVAAVLSRGRPFEIYGAGRTDAGVHALGQVAHLDLQTTLSEPALRMSFNDALPSDINVLDVRGVTRRFHARHSAVARSYLYQVSRRRTAFGKPLVWWVKDPLDVDRMRLAARAFQGLKDFRGFAAGEPEASKVKVEGIEILEEGDLILTRVLGSHFLWKMVRRMVGVLVEVGRGSIPPSEVDRCLEGTSNLPAELTAPPSGLFLERVFYPGEGPIHPLRSVLRLGQPP